MKATNVWVRELGRLVPFSEMAIMICPSNNYGHTKCNGFNQRRKHDYYKNKKWI